MKSGLQQFVQNRIFRWLLSATILCYALVPQIGVCHCLECRCNKDASLPPETVTIEKSTGSACCCCSEESEVSISEVLIVSQSCCSQMLSDTAPSGVPHNSPVCPCSLKSAPPQPTFVSPTSISFQQNLEELLSDGYLPYLFSVSSIPVIKTVTFYLFYESPVSQLPVRLHLLLRVLLN